MAELNLTEAIEALRRIHPCSIIDCQACARHIRESVAIVAPIIERQVRERIAAEIEVRIKLPSDRPIRDTEGAPTAAVTVALQQGMLSAARIARGGAR